MNKTPLATTPAARHGRRKFLHRAAAVSAAAPLLALTTKSRLANAASFDGGYKALVCVYLAGGNDAFNMFVPYSTDAWDAYAAARLFLAVPRTSLLPVNPASYRDGNDYGFHPNMPEVQQLFNARRLSVVANVGTLTAPISAAQYNARSVATPAQLFSHNDQADLWMSGSATTSNGSGWAGEMMECFYGAGQPAPLPAPSISIGGANLWQTGRSSQAFEVTAAGVSALDFPYHGGGQLMETAYQKLHAVGAGGGLPMVSEHSRLQGRAIELTKLVSDRLAGAPSMDAYLGGGGSLTAQLNMVARLIAIRAALDPSTRRQVFFVQLGGWDTHAGQNDNTANSHPNLLRQLSQALGGFDAALNALGMADNVTTFTASEFGRSLTPNGNGTDHGWGGHSLVMGGAVRGGDIIGRMPQLQPNSPDAVETGRIVPTTAVDQMGATLAAWFGLSPAELNLVFPNLGRFGQSNLGFMG